MLVQRNLIMAGGGDDIDASRVCVLAAAAVHACLSVFRLPSNRPHRVQQTPQGTTTAVRFLLHRHGGLNMNICLCMYIYVRTYVYISYIYVDYIYYKQTSAVVAVVFFIDPCRIRSVRQYINCCCSLYT